MTLYMKTLSRARRTRARLVRRAAAGRSGFSLVEIVVAMMLLSVTLLALAALMTQVAAQGRTTEIVAQRNAALVQQVNYFTALSYDALDPALAGCATVESGMMPYERCVEITQAGTTRTVKIRVTPVNRAYRPDSAIFERTALPVNPFNVGN